MRANLSFLAGLTAIAVMFPLASAYAYLDPGTGSFVLQMLLGGIAGLMVVGRLWWEKVKVTAGRVFHRKPGNDNIEKSQ